MKSLTRLFVVAACVMLAANTFAGPEYSSKNVSESAAAPAACNWSGLYFGINAGGQFGHSEDKDLSDWNNPNQPWGYSESGFTGGGQIGYNFQWNWLVLGAEGDVGYMSLEGRAAQKGRPANDPDGSSDGDFFTTMRGRVGVALNSWLIYGTGGAIGVNYTTRVIDNCSTGSCGPGLLDARGTNFDWGYTVGGGVEKMLGCHWSLKVEYLYFALDTERISGVSSGTRYSFDTETAGHIVRAGLNYKF